MTLKELSLKLKSAEPITPGDLSQIRLELSGWFGILADQLQEVLKRKPEKWLEIRKEAKSSAEADKAWEASEDGLQEMKLRWDLKVCEKLMSSIRTRLEVLEKEAQNIF